jgi:MFS family permease
VGTSIEWYDVSVFGIGLPFFLAAVFFPNTMDHLLAVLLGSGAQVLSALCRPFGAAFFGRIGDRVGRKRALIVTLLMAGCCCAAIGFLPPYATIGVAAPGAVFLLRMAIGFALGAEWPGAVLLPLEWAAGSRWRGLWACVPQLGLPIGTLLALGSILATLAIFGHDPNAWRVPFVASLVLVGVGAYLRFQVLDTPTMTDYLLTERRTVRRPVRNAFTRQPRDFFGTAFSRMGELGPGVVVGSFFFIYVNSLKLHIETAFAVAAIGVLFGIASILAFAALSDRVGRVPVFAWGAVCMGAYVMFAYFQLLGTRDLALMIVGQSIGMILTGVIAGPGAAMVAESFSPEVRYSGTGTASGIGAAIAVIAATLFPTYALRQYHDTFLIGAFVSVCCILGIFGAVLLKDRRGQDLAADYREAGAQPA